MELQAKAETKHFQCGQGGYLCEDGCSGCGWCMDCGEAKCSTGAQPNTDPPRELPQQTNEKLQLCAGCDHPKWLHAEAGDYTDAACDFGEGECECPKFAPGEGLACDWEDEGRDVACTAPATKGSRCDKHHLVGEEIGAPEHTQLAVRVDVEQLSADEQGFNAWLVGAKGESLWILGQGDTPHEALQNGAAALAKLAEEMTARA